MNNRVRRRIRVAGIVQGVGFRPFTYSIATELGLGGHVSNDARGVLIEAEGTPERIDRFLTALREQAPPLAVIDQIDVEPLEPRGEFHFHVADSTADGPRAVLVAADSATCSDCLRELSDPADRRFSYPLINCTNCGPRFTITRDVPYDREHTTMAGFPLCAHCHREYHDPTNRRFHAQPVCCPECGPRLRFTDGAGTPVDGDPVELAAAALRRGEVLAVKGLGGYHLAVDATSEDATGALRKRKHRADKPFAVMVADLHQAAELCQLDPAEEALLSSRARPIVLLRRRPRTDIAPAVAPGNRRLGIMLPYTPLHHLLLRKFPQPIVLTSGNVSDEPIAHLDQDALDRLSGIADAFLTHDRPIHIRTDDSVVRVFRGKPQFLRRSRGYVPEPVRVPWTFPEPVLACGAELKNTFAIGKGHEVFLSHHIGDLEDYQTYQSYTEGIAHFRQLFGTDPAVVAHDLHPEYLSTKYAGELADIRLIGVQHHHAHIASCLADNEVDGPVLGIAFDGLGLGADGTIWGGEFLLADLADYRRLAHLEPVPLPGGTTAIRQPWRMAVAYLAQAGELAAELPVLRRNPSWRHVAALLEQRPHSPLTSSAGRLFDAVAALVGVRDAVSYEGQAAIELEQLADPAEHGSYPVTVTGGPVRQLRGCELISAALADLRSGVPVPVISARFHNGLAAAITRTCRLLRNSTGITTVALSGGVFQNSLLQQRTTESLEDHGFRVLVHSRVPANDGGISLGQAVVAAAQLAG